MKKRIISLLAVLILLVSMITLIPASAIVEVEAGETAEAAQKTVYPRLDDGAGLLTDEQEKEILARLDSLSEYYGFDIVIVTTKSRINNTIKSFADSYYHSHGYAENGILLAVDMSDRSYCEFTHGWTNKIWKDDYHFEELENKFVSYISKGDYYSGFTKFIDEVDNQYSLNSDIIDTYKTYVNGNAFQRFMINAGFNLKGALIFGLIAAFALTIFLTVREDRKLKSVAFRKNANDCVVKNSFRLNASRDIFLYRTVTRVRMSSGSRGGHGHGGGSHGGHGGHF